MLTVLSRANNVKPLFVYNLRQNLLVNMGSAGFDESIFFFYLIAKWKLAIKPFAIQSASETLREKENMIVTSIFSFLTMLSTLPKRNISF